jgi:hypothetical protein
MAFSRARYGQGQGDIVLDEVQCDGSEATLLLECNHRELFMHDCRHNEDAGVKCNRDEDNNIIIKNINASIIRLNTPCVSTYTAMITWTPQDTTHEYQLSSHQIECFSRQHHIKMLVSNVTFNVELSGLLPSTPYNCCVSAVYGSYTARGVCTPIQTPTNQPSGSPIVKSSAGNAAIIGGVLGFIIVVLLVLLAVLGAALVYLLRPRLFRHVLSKQ